MDAMSEEFEGTLTALREVLNDDIRIENDNRSIRLVGPGGTELVNAHGPAQADITKWIDRRSNWGNPFNLESDGGSYEREESGDLYRGWFYGHLETDEWTPEDLRGEVLGCWCLPRLCHGVVVMNYLAETYNPQQTLF